MDVVNDEIVLYHRIERLFAEYCACLDEQDLEAWPDFFVDDGLYKMISRENYDHGYPIPLLMCDSKAMMQDRVFSLNNANIYRAHRYRHAMSGTQVLQRNADGIRVRSSYIVVQTLDQGGTELFQAGSYHDLIVEHDGQLKFQERIVVYDTAQIKTLLATPV